MIAKRTILSAGPATFLDYISDYTNGEDQNSANCFIAVTGRSRPGLQWHSAQLASGTTIGLSNQEGEWNTQCSFATSKVYGKVAFADGVYNVDFDTQTVRSGTKVIAWDDPPANVENLKFRLLDGSKCGLACRTDGVYLLKGLTFVVR